MQKRSRKHVRVLGLWWIVALACASPGGAAPPTVAVLADRGANVQISSLASLLEAKLSEDPNLQLVERERIEAVLREQHLSLAGAAEPNTVVPVGRLLRARVLVLLSVESSGPMAGAASPGGGLPTPSREPRGPGLGEASGRDRLEASPPPDKPVGPLLRVRIVETAHGLRLGDSFESLEESQAKETAARIAERVVSVVGKMGQSRGQVIPLGIIDIRSVQLPAKYERLARLLPALLSARLSVEPRLLVLERESLGVLLREKQLAAGTDAAFWNSAVLIDGYIQPGPNAALQVHLRLRGFDGGELQAFAVPVDPNAPAGAAEQAVARIRATIGNTPVLTAWDAAKEAEEFCRQGQLLCAHRRYAQAVGPLEAAHALQPHSVYYTGALFASEWERYNNATYMHSPAPDTGEFRYSDVEIAELAAAFVRQIRGGYEKGELSTQQIYERWVGSSLGPLAPGGGFRGYFGSTLSVATEQVRQINRASRRIWVETFDRALRQHPLAAWDLQSNLRLRIRLVWVSADQPEELFANVKKVFEELVLPDRTGGPTLSASERNALCNQFSSWFSNARLENSHLGATGGTFRTLWLRYLAGLTHSDDPVVRFNTCLDLARANMSPDDEEWAAQERGYAREALKILATQMETSGEVFSYDLYARAYAVRRCLSDLPPEESLRLWTSIYEPLVKKGDALTLAYWDPGLEAHYPVSGPPEVAQGWYELLERIGDVLQTRPDNDWAVRALSRVRTAQAEFRTRNPQLASARTSSGRSVTMLLRKDDWIIPADYLDSTVNAPAVPVEVGLDHEMLWVSLATSSEALRAYSSPHVKGMVLGLAGINLAQRRVTSLWQTVLKHPGSLGGMTVGDEASYVCVQGVGLVEFPGARATGRVLYADCRDVEEARRLFPPQVWLEARGPQPIAVRIESPRVPVHGGDPEDRQPLQRPKVLAQDRGLPSLLVTSLAREGDKLWIAYGGEGQESGLGWYDPHAGRWETVFCSALAGEASFGTGKPYQISHLRITRPGRLVFVLDDFTLTPAGAPGESGFWSLDTATRKTRFLGLGDTVSVPRRPAFLEVQEKWWWFSGGHAPRVAEFDPVAETWKPIEGDLGGGRSSPPRELVRAVAIHNDVLWVHWGRRTIQLLVIGRGKKLEEGQFLDNTILEGDPVLRFLSTPYGLVAIGNGVVGLVETPDSGAPAPK